MPRKKSHKKRSSRKRPAGAGKTAPPPIEELLRLPGVGDTPDHEKAAEAVSCAFRAVTSGPVDGAAVALAEVSRRSPLAPWKMLVRALEAFYRGDDATCLRALDSMEQAFSAECPDPVRHDPMRPNPVRLIETLRQLVGGECRGSPAGAGAGHAADTLAVGVLGPRDRLRKPLLQLDEAFARGFERRIVQATRQAMRVARSEPKLVKRLRQQVEVRALMLRVMGPRLRAALGGPCDRDAHYWRLLARAFEHEGVAPFACAAWERFRHHAVAQGWFGHDGPEAAGIDLHVVALLESFDEEELEEIREDFIGDVQVFTALLRDQGAFAGELAPSEDTELACLRPGRLLERAAQADRDPAVFRRWHNWARRRDKGKEANAVARRWHEACPEDAEPLLALAESASRRGTFTKALGLLDQAEELEHLGPEVRRARRRLLVSMARRHLAQAKPHLVGKDLDVLAGLPHADSGDTPRLLEALHWARVTLQGGKKEARRHRASLCEALESDTAAALVLRGLAVEAGFAQRRTPPLPRRPSRSERGRLISRLARAKLLGDALGVDLELPTGWDKVLVRETHARQRTWTMEDLLAVTRAALACSELRFAYALSAAGLAEDGEHLPRFLVLRGHSLPSVTPVRTLGCFQAAVELAQRSRSPERVREIVELTGSGQGGLAGLLGSLGPYDGEEVAEVLALERQATGYPDSFDDDGVPSGDDWDDEDELDPFCQCPECTRRRRELELEALEEGIPVDDGFMDDDGFFYPGTLEALPPKLQRLLMEATLEYGGPGRTMPDPEVLEQLDPKLFNKIQEAILEVEGDVSPPDFAPPDSARRRRRGRTRR